MSDPMLNRMYAARAGSPIRANQEQQQQNQNCVRFVHRVYVLPSLDAHDRS